MKVLVFLCAIGLACSELAFHPLNAPLMPGSNGRIIGGEDAALGDWPWQASLQRFGSHFCGASLISTGYLMSAAHCSVYQSGVTANLGSIQWQSPEQSLPVSSFLAHPQYNDQTYDYDYGIVIVSTPATLNANVGLVQLADAGAEYPGGTMATTTGWGYIIRFPATIPDTMQVAQIPLVSEDDCNAYWGSTITVTDRMQCAAGNGGASSCMGDSGGPLVVADANVASGYRLIGAVSWGSSTCSNTAPSAYAKISAGRAWIDSIVG